MLGEMADTHLTAKKKKYIRHPVAILMVVANSPRTILKAKVEKGSLWTAVEPQRQSWVWEEGPAWMLCLQSASNKPKTHGLYFEIIASLEVKILQNPKALQPAKPMKAGKEESSLEGKQSRQAVVQTGGGQDHRQTVRNRNETDKQMEVWMTWQWAQRQSDNWWVETGSLKHGVWGFW